jgi:hypothetical protein
MSLSFPRSTRSLVNDTFRPSLIGIGIAVIVLAAWGVWFALARAPVYADGSNATLTREGEVVAQFQEAVFPRVRAGQAAVVIDPVTGDARRAEVMEAANRAQNRLEPNTARIYVYGTALTKPPAQLQVQIGDESPLLALLRLGASVQRRLPQLPSQTSMNQ